MLTCYDYQTAGLLNKTPLDLILVGDSLGNVVLGYETTVQVTMQDMMVFGAAVKRGAPDKFVIVDLPFGSYATFDQGISNGIKLIQATDAEAIKLEGANDINYQIIGRLKQSGVAVMGHIGLQPQSIHSQGGYFKHGKKPAEKEELLNQARALEEAGCFAIVLECVDADLAAQITQAINIPAIGIGSGVAVDGQVLVTNDLLGMGEQAPGFVKPVADLFSLKKSLIEKYINHENNTYN